MSPPPVNQRELSRRGLHALKWNYLGNVARNGSQLVIGILLARWLGPEPFGVVAVAWLVIGVGNLIADLGFGAALVQREQLTQRDLRFVFTCQVSIGAVMTLAGMAFSAQLAEFFHKPEATPVLQAMFSLFLLQSLGQTSAAILRRDLNYKTLQSIGIASYLVGYVLIGLPAAWAGLGVWSLVAAQLSQTLINTTGLMLGASVPIRPSLRADAPGLLGFGSKVVGANLVSYAISNLDSLVIGRTLGVGGLGLYNRAMMLVASPMNAITASLQGVLFSAAARIQSDQAALLRVFAAASMAMAMICLPIFLTVAAVANTVVSSLYGASWSAAIPILIPLALAMPVNALLAVIGPLLMARNRVQLELRAQLITLLVMLPVLYLTSQVSLLAVAWGMLAIYLLRWLLLANALLKELAGSWLVIGPALLWPLLIGLATAAITWTTDHWLSPLPDLPRLAADAGVAAFSLLGCVRVFGRRLMQTSTGQLLLEQDLLPSVLRHFIKA